MRAEKIAPRLLQQRVLDWADCHNMIATESTWDPADPVLPQFTPTHHFVGSGSAGYLSGMLPMVSSARHMGRCIQMVLAGGALLPTGEVTSLLHPNPLQHDRTTGSHL